MTLLPTKNSPESQYERQAPRFQEVLRRDANPPPPDLLEDHPADLGLGELDKARYTSPDFHRRELRRMWRRVWQVACLADEIPEPGDVTTYDIGDESFIVVRTGPTEIKAYYNSCLHRGMQLCEGTSHLQHIRCPFHGFTWNLDGSLKYVPCRWDFPQVTEENFKLREVRTGTWGGFVFINMDLDCIPLEQYLEVMPAHFKGFCDQDKKYVQARYTKILPANWKVAIEAFLESYHSPETHPESLPLASEVNAQYDIFPGARHASRFMQSVGVQSDLLRTRLTEQQMADQLFAGMGMSAPTLGPGETARSLLAGLTRAGAAQQFGLDYTACSEAELLDAIQYFLFPNILLFRGFSFPVGYRFRPNGHDPDTCRFDFMVFRDVPPGQDRPELPDPIDMGDRSFMECITVIAEELRLIYDQDTRNMAFQQRGLKVGGKQTVSLSQYQETRIRHLHRTLDHYLNQ